MFPFFRPKNEKDLHEKLLGKVKRYRLTRNDSTVALTGTLLALFRHKAEPDGLMPPAAGRVDLLAVFLSKAGRFLVYYVVFYPETEDIVGRHEYVHVCDGLDAVRDFLGVMLYPNKSEFAVTVLARTAKTLAGMADGGMPPPVARDVAGHRTTGSGA